MKIGPFHLSYCTNVHPGQDWQKIFSNLKRYVPAVRNRLGVQDHFAMGIWLPEPAVKKLSDPAELDSFLEFLTGEKLYISTVNAFPFGNFHAPPVKESVYLPDWTDRRRLNYSNDVAALLIRFLEQSQLETANLSTVPGAFKPAIQHPDQEKLIARHFLEHAAYLHRLEEEKGRTVSLAIEPEPFCFLETTGEVIEFFQSHLVSPPALRFFSELTGTTRTAAAESILRHLGICYDVCHLAVQFENSRRSIERLHNAGIQILRLQLSSAVQIEISGRLESTLERLSPFAEDVYLHQVVEKDSSGLRRFADLPEAIKSLGKEGIHIHPRQWRIHFHLPIFLSETLNFGTTQTDILEVLQLIDRTSYCRILEVETYTWNVLPEELRTDDLISDIARELDWVRSKLTAKASPEKSFGQNGN